MKAIAIINVPDGMDVDELCITFNLERMLDDNCNTEVIYEDISEPLRPLPERKPVHYIDNIFGELVNYTNMGYNDCLDEITGK